LRRNSVVDPLSLGTLSIQEWKMILSGAHINSHPKDSVILKEGDWNRNMYRVKKGVVRIEKEVQLTSTESKRVVLARLDKHKVFGEMSFLEDSWKPEDDDNSGNVSATVVAETEVETYKIDRLFLLQLFRSNQSLFDRFYKIVALMLAERCINLPYKREVDKQRGLSVATAHKIDSFPSPPVPVESKEETTKRNTKFQKRFRLPASEFVIAEYSCMYSQGKKSRYHGTLFIGRRDIGFFGKIFGRKVKFTIRMNNITRIERGEENRFTIYEENSKEELNYIFQTTEEDATPEEVISVIESICDATRNRSEYKRTSSDGPKISLKAGRLLGNISLEDLRNSLDMDQEYTPRGRISRKSSLRSVQSSTTEDPVRSVEEKRCKAVRCKAAPLRVLPAPCRMAPLRVPLARCRMAP